MNQTDIHATLLDQPNGVFIDVVPMMHWRSARWKRIDDLYTHLLAVSRTPQSPVRWKRAIKGCGVLLLLHTRYFIREHGITRVVMGSDWEGENGFIAPYCEVRYLPRTEGVSTSGIMGGL